MDKERFELSKDFVMNGTGNWFNVRNFTGENLINIWIDNDFADDVVESIFYGVNTHTPDREIKFNINNPDIQIKVVSIKDVKYVSSYLKFKDGSTSETRIKKMNE